ncbi:MAG: hypothetical protein NDJ94_09120 [Vicinamibacteria bacterium]|nr:hypothetical protein [Vicinamibacteria bacterium]
MDWSTVFLGVIALASLVQAGFLVALALSGRRLAQRIDQLQQRLDKELAPALASFVRVSRNLEEVADLAVIQARRVDDLLADTLEKVQDTTTQIQRVVLRPLRPITDLVAFLRGIKKGVEVYRQFGSLGDDSRRARARRADAEDDHLFI